MDDIDLLRRYAADRSEAAFAELVRRHVNLVYRAALRQAEGSAHRAEDVTQRVFTLLARKAASLTRHTSLTGWLYTTTHFTMSELLRSERRRQIREQRAYAMQDLSTDEIPDAQWGRMRPVLDAAMQDLSLADREAILLRFFEGLPFADVGAKLSLREDTARMRVTRALEKLRASLAKRGVMSTTTALTAILADEAAAAVPAGLAATVTGTALSSAAGAGWETMSLWQAFHGAKAALLTAGMLSLAAGIAFYEWRGALDAHAALSADQTVYEAGQERLANLERKAEAAERGRNETQRTLAGLRSAASAAGTAAAAWGDDDAWAGERVDRQAFLAAFPEAKGIFLKMFQSRIATEYEGFYKSAGLTPVQIGQFETVMAEKLLQNTTLTTTGIRAVESPPAESLMGGVLDDETYREFQDYSRNAFARGFTARVAATVDYAAPPLTADQADRLTGLLVTNASADADGQGLDPGSIAWSEVATQVRDILPDAQWKGAEELFLEEQFGQAYAEARKAQAMGSARPAPSP